MTAFHVGQVDFGRRRAFLYGALTLSGFFSSAVSAQAVDRAGTVDDSPASLRFFLDRTGPETVLNAVPRVRWCRISVCWSRERCVLQSFFGRHRGPIPVSSTGW
jgi:hypothetical protein